MVFIIYRILKNEAKENTLNAKDFRLKNLSTQLLMQWMFVRLKREEL
jgi:hypothetical protein